MGRPFRFQSLLDYRKRLVDDRQLALALLQRQLTVAQSHLAQLQADHARFLEALRPLVNGVLHIDQIEHQYRYLAKLENEIGAQQSAVDTAALAVESARAQLEAAMKDLKTLEKLKEYDAQSYQESLRQHEAKTVDDLNISRYNRNEHQ